MGERESESTHIYLSWQEEDKRALEKAQEQAKNKDVPAKRPSKRPDLKAITKVNRSCTRRLALTPKTWIHKEDG